VPFAEIDKVARGEDLACVWRKGHDQIAAQIPASARNAPVLLMLLSEWTEQHRVPAAPEPAIAAEAPAGMSHLGCVCFLRYSWSGGVVGFHEQGLSCGQGVGLLEIADAEVTELTYRADHLSSRNSFGGAHFSLTCVTPQGKIRYWARVTHVDEGVVKVRDQIARAMAGRMLRELQAGRAVAWTGILRLLPTGGARGGSS